MFRTSHTVKQMGEGLSRAGSCHYDLDCCPESPVAHADEILGSLHSENGDLSVFDLKRNTICYRTLYIKPWVFSANEFEAAAKLGAWLHRDLISEVQATLQQWRRLARSMT